jgi:hypothetical protein
LQPRRACAHGKARRSRRQTQENEMTAQTLRLAPAATPPPRHNLHGRRADRVLVLLGAGESAATAPQLSQPALLRLFFKLAQLWQLSGPEQCVLLGGTSQHTLEVWRSGLWRKVPVDVQDRIEHLLCIHCTLLGLAGEAGPASWLRTPNTAEPFGGQPPLQRLLAGRIRDLLAVHQHLDGLRHRGRHDQDRELAAMSDF